MNIGELSKKIDLPTKTIRYYEEIGLISKAGRMENGYRSYNDSNIDELKVIKYARELGLPIEKIKHLMRGCKSGDCSHSEKYLTSEIDDYLSILKEREIQMSELKRKLTALKISIKTKSAFNPNSKYCCNILGQLARNGGERS